MSNMFPRNVLIHDGERLEGVEFKGEWIAVPREDYDARTSEPDSFTDLVQLILTILPQATFGDDNDGQIIIYTNKAFVSDQTAEETDDIIDMEEPE